MELNCCPAQYTPGTPELENSLKNLAELNPLEGMIGVATCGVIGCCSGRGTPLMRTDEGPYGVELRLGVSKGELLQSDVFDKGECAR